MLTQGQNIPNGYVKSTQVCIIGAGPAGITLAWYLNQAGIKVILLEGSRYFGQFSELGNIRYEDKLLLSNGVVDGVLAQNEPHFLVSPRYIGDAASWERERYLGGTSLHWGGQCRPLDPITFEKRKNFPSWPIDRCDLDPFYREAYAFCQLYNYNQDLDNWETYFEAEFWAKQIPNAKVPELLGLDVDMYQFITQQDQKHFNLKAVDGKTLKTSHFEVIVNGTALEMDINENNIRRLKVGSITMDLYPPCQETEFYIQADAYVLACGGVANARQLLLNGIGKEYDQVGRNFITQSLVDGAINLSTPYLTTEEKNLLNGGKYDEVNVRGRIVPRPNVANELGIGRCWFRQQGNSRLYWEQSPNLDSRITLADTCDPVFGQFQTQVNWAMNQQDEYTFNQLILLFRAALIARCIDPPASDFICWEDLVKVVELNGHHLGTTRMSESPENGVVDKNLKVHDLDNLFVAGSSVFTTGGLANPTFTIIALSIRLAAYLSSQLGGNAILIKSS